MKIENKNIVITGGSKGLGAELARKLAIIGANIIVLARTDDLLKGVVESIKEQINEDKKEQINGQIIDYIVCDLTSNESVENAIEGIKKKFDRVDILINNAGMLNSSGFNSSFEAFDRIMELNVNGYMRMIMGLRDILGRPIPISSKRHKGNKSGEKEALKLKEGMVVIVSSLSALIIPHHMPFYGISKVTTRAISIGLREHYLLRGQKRMKVLNVNPPQFDTGIYSDEKLKQWLADTKNKGWFFPTEKIADSIIKGIRKNKRELNLTKFGKITAFGIRFFPKMLYYFARRQFKTYLKSLDE